MQKFMMSSHYRHQKYKVSSSDSLINKKKKIQVIPVTLRNSFTICILIFCIWMECLGEFFALD